MKTLSLLIVCASFLSASVASDPEVASAIRLYQAWVEAQMAHRGQPGVSIGIVHDQELIWAQGFGYADLEKKIPATPKTLYRMASNTKMFTALAVMQLRDEGRLQLDDPVARRLPWFKVRNAHPDGPVITIRHLLTHTSGLPREAALTNWTDVKMPSRQQMIDGLSSQETVLPVETQWKYSNLALTLAGEIVQAVSGQPYVDYIHKNILEPLGMTSTTVVLPAEHRPRLATGYGRRMPGDARSLRPYLDTAGVIPAGNITSNVEDFARFASLQFRDGPRRGAQVLRGSTLREMHRVHWMEPSWRRGWGLGFHTWRLGERVLVGHGGSLPGFRTHTYISPADKIAVLVMTNADDGDPQFYGDQAFQLVAPAIAKAAASPKPAKADPAWARYLGKYRNASGDSQVMVLNDELVLLTPADPYPRPSMLKLIPAGEHTFRIQGDIGYAALGETARFEVGADGKVARLWIGPAAYTLPMK